MSFPIALYSLVSCNFLFILNYLFFSINAVFRFGDNSLAMQTVHIVYILYLPNSIQNREIFCVPGLNARCVQTGGGNGKAGCCVFPFTYRGIQYLDCTDLDHDQKWCAVTSDYDVDGQWGNCIGARLLIIVFVCLIASFII